MVDDDDGGKCCGDLCRELLVARCASWSWRAHFGAAWMSAVFSSVGSSTGKLSPISHASSLNYAAGQTIPNLVIAKLGAGDIRTFAAKAARSANADKAKRLVLDVELLEQVFEVDRG